jgi:broad specificity phosphatase PhoE
MPECIQHKAIQEYHCGRVQGRTRTEGRAIAEAEGISYETFRFQGGAEVHSLLYSFRTALTNLKSKEAVRNRVGSFWNTELVPLCATEAIVLIVSHGGIIARLNEYLKTENYTIRESVLKEMSDSWSWEVRNCSISEVSLDAQGSGEIIRAGDCEHLNSIEDIRRDRLENSTG